MKFYTSSRFDIRSYSMHHFNSFICTLPRHQIGKKKVTYFYLIILSVWAVSQAGNIDFIRCHVSASHLQPICKDWNAGNVLLYDTFNCKARKKLNLGLRIASTVITYILTKTQYSCKSERHTCWLLAEFTFEFK